MVVEDRRAGVIKGLNQESFPHSVLFLWYSGSQKLWLDCWQSTCENWGFCFFVQDILCGCMRRSENVFVSWIKTVHFDIADKELKLLNQWYTRGEYVEKIIHSFFLSFFPLLALHQCLIQPEEPGTEEEGSNWYSKPLFLDTFTLFFCV